jgi:hypothetical protein
LDLIDWSAVVRNALWIAGLSIVLAGWSYTSWWAARRGVRMRTALGRRIFLVPFAAGMALFSGSLAWGAGQLWERGLWILLVFAFSWQAAQEIVRKRTP